MNCLVIGGTSGLGLSLASLLTAHFNNVIVTGRRSISQEGLEMIPLSLTGDDLEIRLGEMVDKLAHIDTLVYAAGFLQMGTITELETKNIDDMMKVGLVTPMYLVRALLQKQGALSEFIAITSTSQWTPRLDRKSVV